MNVLPLYSRPKLLLAAALFSVTLAGCHRNQPTVTDVNNTGDPAEANLAASDGIVPDSSGNVQQGGQQPLSSSPSSYPQSAAARTRRVLGARSQNESQQQAEEYPQQGYTDNGQGAPIERRAPEYTDGNGYGNGYNQGYDGQPTADTYDQGYNTGMDAVEEADQPPPPLPVYNQPPCPEPNDQWTPGYWNYAPAGYYWVPGAWIAPPYSGALWTPGYWGYGGNRYRFHRGFWGPHVGFYGGVAYGFGYTGYGYQGGYWNGNNFYYNRSVTRVNTTNITNVYNHTVIVNNNTTINRVSYNGGNGGIQAQPRPAEIAALHETRVPPMASQVQLRQTAAVNRQQFFSANQGRPSTVVSARPLAATPGIAPPAVRLASANAPRPAAATFGRPNLPQSQQANQQHVAPQQPANLQHPTPQQPANQQHAAPQQQLAARPAEAGRVTPQQQRLNSQQQVSQQQVAAQQQASQQRVAAQQQASQQRVAAQQQASQQRVAQQQASQQRVAQQHQQEAMQQQRAAAQQARPAPTAEAPQQQRTVEPQPQTRPEVGERPQPSRPVTPQPAPRPVQPTVRPAQPAPRAQTAAPRVQQAPREEARPAEGRPH